jgi:hypothetical protein
MVKIAKNRILKSKFWKWSLDFFYAKSEKKNSKKSPDSTIGFQCVAMNIGGWLKNLYFVFGL